MILPAFEWHRPATFLEAVDLLTASHDAAVIAGGTELLLLMKLGLAEHDRLIDISRLPEIAEVRHRDGVVHIGAGVTHRQAEGSGIVRRHCPAYAAMTSRLANLRVRAQGTVGGNLCFADPHSDVGAFLLAAGATLVGEDRTGTHRWSVDEFQLGGYENALPPGALLREIELPATRPGEVIAHHRFVTGERPTSVVSVRLAADAGEITSAVAAIGCIQDRPLRITLDALLGQSRAPDPGILDELRASVTAALSPTDDVLGSADYKAHVSGVLVRRAVTEALARLAGEPSHDHDPRRKGH